MKSIDILNEKKIKKTSSRIEILNYIINKKKVTIKNLLEYAPNINQSTIYRILELFERKKIIIKIFEHELFYCFNEEEHKHYIECINCHNKEQIDICPYNLVDLKGYKVLKDEIIKGVCHDCQQKKIGIFVGSFDPFTRAHLEIAIRLYNQNIIDEIVYVPCNSLKKKNLFPLETRFDLLSYAVRNYQYIKVSNIELLNKSPSFDYKEMNLLKKEFIGNLYIIIGADNLLELDKWNNYHNLLCEYNFIVINRFNIDALKIIKEKYIEYKEKFIIFDFESDISSTIVREKIQNHEDLSKYLSKEVIFYIKNNQLY